jgi:hypothetical protein
VIWDLPGVVGFARDGGWRHDTLAEAAAVALAASGGDDALVDMAEIGGLSATAGLWQVPVSDRVGFDVDSLLRPALNAAAAHRLYVEAGGTWAWSAWWGAPGWDRYLADAQAAVKAGRDRQWANDLGPVDRIRQAAGAAADTAKLTAAQLSALAAVIRSNTPR